MFCIIHPIIIKGFAAGLGSWQLSITNGLVSVEREHALIVDPWSCPGKIGVIFKGPKTAVGQNLTAALLPEYILGTYNYRALQSSNRAAIMSEI